MLFFSDFCINFPYIEAGFGRFILNKFAFVVMCTETFQKVYLFPEETSLLTIAYELG